MPRAAALLTMAEASDAYGFTISTLRAERDRGRLDTFRIGKREYTTPEALEKMVEQCRVVPKACAST